MVKNDYFLEATLYYPKSTYSKQKALIFRRFTRAADAILFAVEELTPKLLASCTLEVNDADYFGREILPLYDDHVFPLQRKLSAKYSKKAGTAGGVNLRTPAVSP